MARPKGIPSHNKGKILVDRKRNRCLYCGEIFLTFHEKKERKFWHNRSAYIERDTIKNQYLLRNGFKLLILDSDAIVRCKQLEIFINLKNLEDETKWNLLNHLYF